MDASRRNASAFRLRLSQSFASRLASPKPCECSFHDPSLWQDDKAFSAIRALDDFDIHLRHYFRRSAAKHRPLIAAIGVEFQQERIHAEHGRDDQRAAITILNVGGVHDGVDQQALRVDKNVPLLALDVLSRVVTRQINRGPPFQRFSRFGCR